ncbi:hypothetical protein GF407_10130 [candidate division KSB1 bacterium]|nr:hypothetical protein [candidate division KSB1 bacterium]
MEENGNVGIGTDNPAGKLQIDGLKSFVTTEGATDYSENRSVVMDWRHSTEGNIRGCLSIGRVLPTMQGKPETRSAQPSDISVCIQNWITIYGAVRGVHGIRRIMTIILPCAAPFSDWDNPQAGARYTKD